LGNLPLPLSQSWAVSKSPALSSGLVPAFLCWEQRNWEQQEAFVLCFTTCCSPSCGWQRSRCISDFPCKLSPPLRLLGADVSTYMWTWLCPFHKAPFFTSVLDMQQKGRWVCLVLSGW